MIDAIRWVRDCLLVALVFGQPLVWVWVWAGLPLDWWQTVLLILAGAILGEIFMRWWHAREDIRDDS